MSMFLRFQPPLWFVLVCLGLLLSGVSLANVATEQPIAERLNNVLFDLSGRWQFYDGQLDPRQLQPGDQTTVIVPGSLTLQGQLLEVGGIYQRTFVLNPKTYQNPYLLIAELTEADQVFINGHRIGGSGIIGRQLLESQADYYSPRFYRLPRAILNANQQQQIQVVVQSWFMGGGITAGPVAIGEFHQLQPLALQLRNRHRSLEVVVFVVLLISLLLILVLSLYPAMPARRRELRALAIVLLIVAFCNFCESLILQESGYKGLWATCLGNGLFFLLLVPLNRFILYSQGRQYSVVWQLIELLALLGVLAALAIQQQWAVTVGMSIWAISLLAIGWGGAAVAWMRWRAGQLDGFAVAGYSCMALTTFYAVAVSFSFGLHWVWALTALFFVISYARQVGILYTRFFDVTQRLANAIEDERSRLARELHDGLGQQLATLRLQLQMRAANDDALNKEADEIGRAMEELRRIIHDQRPLALEQHNDFLDALRSEIERINLFGQARVSLHTQLEELRLPLDQARHVLRIIQECLNNASKHAQASAVAIHLSRSSGYLELEVINNGQLAGSTDTANGFGNLHMQDRATLLNARLDRRMLPDDKRLGVRLVMPLNKE